MGLSKVEVVRIEEILPHHGADRLELAKIGTQQCVIPKNRYHVGDHVIFFPVGAQLLTPLSDKLEVTKYLVDQRVVVTKIRGQRSEGIIIPNDQGYNLHVDLTALYEVTFDEEEVAAPATTTFKPLNNQLSNVFQKADNTPPPHQVFLDEASNTMNELAHLMELTEETEDKMNILDMVMDATHLEEHTKTLHHQLEQLIESVKRIP